MRVYPKVYGLGKNQYEIYMYDSSGNFESYDSTICVVSDEGTFLDDRYWDYSVTTGKYRNEFLGETKKETLKKIESGEYQLRNLN